MVRGKKSQNEQQYYSLRFFRPSDRGAVFTHTKHTLFSFPAAQYNVQNSPPYLWTQDTNLRNTHVNDLLPSITNPRFHVIIYIKTRAIQIINQISQRV